MIIFVCFTELLIILSLIRIMCVIMPARFSNLSFIHFVFSASHYPAEGIDFIVEDVNLGWSFDCSDVTVRKWMFYYLSCWNYLVMR